MVKIIKVPSCRECPWASEEYLPGLGEEGEHYTEVWCLGQDKRLVLHKDRLDEIDPRCPLEDE